MTVCFITGAARGFGVEITRQALGRGDQVAATARHPEAITEAIPDAGDALLTLPLDVTSAGQAAAAVSVAVARFGKIDSLVNNAGHGLLGAVEEVSDAEARAAFEVNVFGLLTVTRAVLPVMREQGAGCREDHQHLVFRRIHRAPWLGGLLRDEVRGQGPQREHASRTRAARNPGHGYRARRLPHELPRRQQPRDG
jgi:NAD(P)-dependent dehydrogenase (short-subunit alcohol dehydrogenase family)